MNLWRIEGEQVRLAFHSAQLQAWDATERFVFLVMGTQSGKTSYGPWWLRREIDRNGPGDYLAVTATYDLFKLKMLPEIRTVFEHVLKIGRYWAGDKIMEICEGARPGGKFLATRADDPMWARIILRSAESPGGLESATALAAWGDEIGQDSFSLTAWDAILRRLSLSQGRFLGTTTPYNLGWMKTEVVDRAASDRDYKVIHAPSIVNPSFPRAEFDRAKATMPAWKFRMFYEGMFDKPAGMIYGDFDEAVHVIDAVPLGREWPRYVGIDFGANNTALVWIAEDKATGNFYVYDESLEGGMATPEHAQQALHKAEGVHVWTWMGGAKGETQQRMDWNQSGVPVRGPLVDDVEAGIDRVVGLWRTRRLYVFRNCRKLRSDLGSYRRELGKDGQPTEKIYMKDSYHMADALRYAAQAFTVPEIPLGDVDQAEQKSRWAVVERGEGRSRWR